MARCHSEKKNLYDWQQNKNKAKVVYIQDHGLCSNILSQSSEIMKNMKKSLAAMTW